MHMMFACMFAMQNFQDWFGSRHQTESYTHFQAHSRKMYVLLIQPDVKFDNSYYFEKMQVLILPHFQSQHTEGNAM